MKPAVRYWIFLLAIVLVVFAVISASFVGSWHTLDAAERAFVETIYRKLIPFPLLGAVVLVAIIGTLVSLLFRYYIIPILQMAEATRLISVVNPEYRLETKGGKELVHLAGVINESAAAFQRLRDEVDGKVREARERLEEERTRLAALMSELPSGVVVCNSDGRILLYNPQAQSLLCSPGPERLGEAGGLVGIGRSVFGILERDPVVHGLELLQQGLRGGREAPTSAFMTTTVAGLCLRVNMAPVFSGRPGEREISGFVLTLEEMTKQIEADTRRDMLIQSLTEGLQDSLGEIRRSISTILSEPELRPEQLQGHRQTIEEASLSLQSRLVEARKNYAVHLQALSKVESVLAENLLQVLRKNVEERYGVEVESEADGGLWLEIDSYSIVQALSHLAGLLKAREGLAVISIDLKRSESGRAVLSIGCPGGRVNSGVVSEWIASPLVADSQGRLLSIEDVIAQHGGSIGMGPEGAENWGRLRIELPAAGEEGRIDFGRVREARPVNYEFDLFHRNGLGALGAQPLRKLTCVVFDTETTGLNPSQGDEIIQLGAVRIVNGRILQGETIDQLVDPRRRVPPESVAIHGIEPELLRGQPTIETVLPHFHRFAEGAVLVAHNAAFDMRFLQLKEERTGIRFANPVLDTLLLSSVVHPHQDSHSLDEIAQRLNINVVGRHTALGDSLVTAEVLLKLIPLLEAEGIQTLEDALDASARSAFARMKF